MTVLYVVVLVVLGLLLLLAIVGGAIASRRNRAGEAGLRSTLAAVDRELARAVAADRGWERGALEASARSAFAERRPDEPIAGMELVQVIDEPGTDRDLAIFRVLAGSPPHASRLTLGRHDDGAWYAAALEDER
ncbi:MAG TPA: hypothetical protein VFU94_04175 [Conexibacter sp.]|nr:hypothetical protein [Conexibacter sp.]